MAFQISSTRLSVYFLLIAAMIAPWPCVARASEDKAAALYEEAVIQFNQDDVDTAIIHLKNLLMQDPSHLSAHILLGRSYLRTGNLDAAEETLEYANSRGADISLTAKLLARLYLTKKSPEKIFNSFDLARFTRADQGEILVFHGYAYLQMNMPEKAEDAFKRASQLLPYAASPLIGAATLFTQVGRYEKAFQSIAAAQEIAPENSDVWHASAAILHARGNLEEAAAHYSKAIEFNPNRFDARLARAGVLMDLKKDQQARDDLETLRDQNPFDPRPAYLAAVLLDRLNKPKAAEKALEEAALIFDRMSDGRLRKDAQGLFLAGLVNYSLNRFERSLNFLNLFMRQFPGHLGARKLKGSILISKKEIYKAIEVLEPGLRESSNDFELLALLGHAQMLIGDYNRATELLEQATVLRAGNADLQRKLGVAWLGQGVRGPALEALRSAFELDPEQTQAGILVGVLHMKQGEPEKAIRVAKIISEREPENLTALNLLASAQIASGKRSDGRLNFERAVAINPEFLPARFNLGKLDLAEGKVESARNRFKTLLQERPDNTRALIEMARVEERAGKTDAAIRVLEKARSLDNRLLPARLYLVDLYLEAGNSTRALEVAEEAEALAPEDQKALEQLGRSLWVVDNAPMASVIFRRMAKHAGSDARQLYKIALYQFAVFDDKEAVWNLSTAVAADPEFVPARIALAKTLLRTGQAEQALQHAREVQKQAPEHADGYIVVGEYHASNQDYEEALESFRKALTRKNELPLAVRIYQIYEKTNRRIQGIEFLQDWVKNNPQSFLAKKALAEAFLAAGQLDKALRNYEFVLESRANDADALNNVAFILDAKDDPRALDFARAAYKSSPESAFVNDTLGWLLVKNDQPEQGLKYLRFAHARAANDPEIRFHTAEALNRLGRVKEAISELEAGLSKKVSFSSEKQARTLLKTLKQ